MRSVIMISLVAACALTSGGQDTIPSGLANYYYSKAEGAAGSLDSCRDGNGASARDYALADVAAGYLEADRPDASSRIAADLPASLRRSVLFLTPIVMAEKGNGAAVIEALEAVEVADVPAVIRALSCRMPDLALSLIERVPEDKRSSIYRTMVDAAVGHGDTEFAVRVYPNILDPKDAAAAEATIHAGRSLDGAENTDIAKVTDSVLATLLLERAKRDDPAKVAERAATLSSRKARGEIYVALASRYLSSGDVTASAGAIVAASESVCQIQGEDLAANTRLTLYLQIADLQLSLNDRAGAVRTIRCVQAEYANAQKELAGVPPPFVDAVLFELMIRGGLEEEARKWSKLDNESIRRAKLIIAARAYASQPEKLECLLRGELPSLAYDAYMAAAKVIVKRRG